MNQSNAPSFDDHFFNSKSQASLSLENNHLYETNDSRTIIEICGHVPQHDPRLSHFAECAPDSMRVHQFGVSFYNDEPSLSLNTKGNLVVSYKAVDEGWHDEILAESLLDPYTSSAIEGYILKLYDLAYRQDDYHFAKILGIEEVEPRLTPFRWLLKYILRISFTFLKRLDVKGADYIVAVDLPALPVALLLGEKFNVPVCYDAHEYWPEADIASSDWERAYWRRVCKILIPYCKHNVTVSSGLMEIMSEEFGTPFQLVPNTEPLSARTKKRKPTLRPVGTETRFIFQGSFAEQRGLEELIETWQHADQNSLLYLRAKDSPVKDKCVSLAKKYGLLDKSVFFLEPVPEHELVSALNDFDVGIIPYLDRGLNYRHCCPNKLSQYAAAGLAIFANDLPYLRDTIERGRCGLVCDMSDSKLFLETVAILSDANNRYELQKKALEFFENDFHFENYSSKWYKKIEEELPGENSNFLFRHDTADEEFALPPQRSTYQTKFDNARKKSALLPALVFIYKYVPRSVRTFAKAFIPAKLIRRMQTVVNSSISSR